MSVMSFIRKLLIKLFKLDDYILVNDRLFNQRDYHDLIKDFSGTIYCKMLNDYLSFSCDLNRLLQINKEMGMKGYWYVRGYLKCGQDISRFINGGKK